MLWVIAARFFFTTSCAFSPADAALGGCGSGNGEDILLALLAEPAKLLEIPIPAPAAPIPSNIAAVVPRAIYITSCFSLNSFQTMTSFLDRKSLTVGK